jgi:hypothetical protein
MLSIVIEFINKLPIMINIIFYNLPRQHFKYLTLPPSPISSDLTDIRMDFTPLFMGPFRPQQAMRS